MPQDVFSTLPYEIILLIVSHIPVLGYYNVKLAFSPRLSDAIRAAQSRFSKAEYLEHITREDAVRKGLPKGRSRKAMEILIERGSRGLMLHYMSKYQSIESKRHYKNEQYSAVLSVNILRQEKECFSWALHWAAAYGNISVALPLMDRVNLRVGNLGQTALHCAARNNQVEMVELLLRNGTYINAMDDSAMTPLGLALQYGANEVAVL
ncbi:ankyrin repeat-containing domain protein [Aspergillus heterothallicus]